MTLDEFEALEKAATPGKWVAKKCEDEACWCNWIDVPQGDTWIAGPGEIRAADAAFIAACRDIVPKLIKALRAADFLAQKANPVTAHYRHRNGLASNQAFDQLSNAQICYEECRAELEQP